MRIWMIGSVFMSLLAGCTGSGDSSGSSVPSVSTTVVARPERGVAPTRAQAESYRAELGKMLAGTSARKVAVASLASGTQQAAVDGLGSVALARYGADGEIDRACVDDVDAAMGFLTTVESSNGLEVK